jgi:hypothetical protein
MLAPNKNLIGTYSTLSQSHRNFPSSSFHDNSQWRVKDAQSVLGFLFIVAKTRKYAKIWSQKDMMFFGSIYFKGKSEIISI